MTDSALLQEEIERVRTRGWALVDGELEEGLRSIAAPLHNREGKVTAAINVSTVATAQKLDEIHDRFVPALLSTARAIDADLAHL